MTSTKREHSTGYVRISETDTANHFEIFAGKSGKEGKASFNAVLSADGKSFDIEDVRTATIVTYAPAALNDGKVSSCEAAKIATTTIDQLVKKFMVEKPVKVAKEKVPKVAKEPKEKKVKAEKPAKEKLVKAIKEKKPKATIDNTDLEVSSSESGADEVLDASDTENTVLVSKRKFTFKTKDMGQLISVTVSRQGKDISTTIGKNDSVSDAVEQLALRLINEYTPNAKAAKK